MQNKSRRYAEMEQFIRQMAEARKYGREFTPSDPNDAVEFCNNMIDKARDIMLMDETVYDDFIAKDWPNRETWSFTMYVDYDEAMVEYEAIIERLAGDNDWNSRNELHALVFNAKCDFIDYLHNKAADGGYSSDEVDMVHIASVYMDDFSFYEAGYDYTGNVPIKGTRLFVDFGMARDWLANEIDDSGDTATIYRQNTPWKTIDPPHWSYWVEKVEVEYTDEEDSDDTDVVTA